MPIRIDPAEPLRALAYLARWISLAATVGVLGGTASAAFLVSLDWATRARLERPWLLWLLPAAGFVIATAYSRIGRGVERGNNLVIDEVHDPKQGVPLRLAPAILVATVATHLFGGSAGREGTAVQMGGGLAGWLSRLLRLDPPATRRLLMAGISAGFGSVFGTPLAGAVFGLEVLAVGRMRYDALVPCLTASLVGDRTCTAWGVHHMQYAVAHVPPMDAATVAKLLAASAAFALAAAVFAELTHALQAAFRLIPWEGVRPVVGGAAVIALTFAAGTQEYLGIGTDVISRAFEPSGVATWAFAWKLVFTSVTLASGFKGGEVTPLFFVGATLGCTLAGPLGLPGDWLAAMGLAAVFGAAANTPLACTAMGIELFGGTHAVPLAMACAASYVLSGHRGIYLSQRLDTGKADEITASAAGATLREIRERCGPPKAGEPGR